MNEQLPATANTDACNIYDFGLVVARKKLAAYGVTASDFDDPEPCPVVEFEPARERILARSALDLCKITPELQVRLTERYESIERSTKLFFQLSGFNPPEHGDISF